MEKDVRNWLDLSHYDLKTAEAMFSTRRYLYVLFTCQQAVEKMLKGLVVKNTQQFPPKTHNLIRLAQLAAIELDKRQSEFLNDLSFYYLETRYPEEIRAISKKINREMASDYLKKTKEMLRWLRQKIQ